MVVTWFVLCTEERNHVSNALHKTNYRGGRRSGPQSPPCSHPSTRPAGKDHSFAVYAEIDLSTKILIEPGAAIVPPPTATRLSCWLRPGPKS